MQESFTVPDPPEWATDADLPDEPTLAFVGL